MLVCAQKIAQRRILGLIFTVRSFGKTRVALSHKKKAMIVLKKPNLTLSWFSQIVQFFQLGW